MVTDPFADRTADRAVSASLAAINMLNHDLAEKYGTPVTEKGECDLTVAMVLHDPNSFSCEKMWKSDGQSVRMVWYWSLSRRLVSVILTYSSLPKDL